MRGSPVFKVARRAGRYTFGSPTGKYNSPGTSASDFASPDTSLLAINGDMDTMLLFFIILWVQYNIIVLTTASSEWSKTWWLLWHLECDTQQEKRGLCRARLSGRKKVRCALRSKMNGKSKNSENFCVYNLQINLQSTKHTAVKGTLKH